jgi:hypothetical protein
MTIGNMSDQEGGLEAHNPFDKAQTVDPEVRAHVYSLVTAVCMGENV